MRTLKLAATATIALAVAACPGDQPPPREIEAEGEPDPVITAATREVALQDMTGIGLTGTVHITPAADSVVFHVTVEDAPPDATLGVRVQLGTCSTPGRVEAVLEAIRTGVLGNGRGQRSLGEEPRRLLDGQHVVAVYAPAAEPERDRPLACAQIPLLQ